MNYIILAAGMGTRLHPFTKNMPKCLLKIGHGETVIQRMIRIIRECDETSEITVVTGFKSRELEEVLSDSNVEFEVNPFYSVTNSICSLWFVREKIKSQCVIINADVVISKKLAQQVVVPTATPYVLYDSSILSDGDYNVQVRGENVVVMSKKLNKYHGEYAGITKLDAHSGEILSREIEKIIEDGSLNEWYENALVQMILNSEFELKFMDISEFQWTEIDSVNNLLLAREIQDIEWKKSHA